MMDIRPVVDEPSYDWALGEIAAYFDHEPARGTAEAARFDVLAALIGAYEATAHPIPPPHPIDAITERMADKGLSRRQLIAATGIAESKLSEVLARKVPLSLTMIRRLAPALDLPVEVLVQAYPVAGRAA